MPRKGPAPKRPVVADPVYGAPIVSQLVNKILLDGKKGLAERIVYGALAGVGTKSGEDAVVVLKKGETASKEELLGFMQGKIAKWWMPDDVAFVDEIPHTATGKIQKTVLRERFKDYRLPNVQAAE